MMTLTCCLELLDSHTVLSRGWVWVGIETAIIILHHYLESMEGLVFNLLIWLLISMYTMSLTPTHVHEQALPTPSASCR